jgi:hypothetical protein
MDLSFAASSDGVIGHQLGDEEFFSGAGELNSAADTVRQGNQVFQVAGFFSEGAFNRSPPIHHSRFCVAVGLKNLAVGFSEIENPFVLAPLAYGFSLDRLEDLAFSFFRVHGLTEKLWQLCHILRLTTRQILFPQTNGCIKD